MASTSTNKSAYGISVKENEALYSKYLGAYGDVLKGIQSVGNAQRGAITDFYAAKQGASDQSLASRGLTNTTVKDAVDRGLTLDEAKAQSGLAEGIAGLRANYGSQMAQGIHSFLGGGSQGQSQGTQDGFAGTGFSNGSVAQSPFANRLFPFGGGGGGGGSYGFSSLGMNMGSGLGGSMYGGGGPMGGFAGVQGDAGYQFGPSGAVSGMGGGDEFGVPSGMGGGYDESAYAWA